MERWNRKFEAWLALRLPPGIPAEREQANLMLGMVASIVWAALSYMGAYAGALSNLYILQGGKRVLDVNARMADFGLVFRFVPAGYFLFLVWLVVKGFGFQAYHRQGSMSIYLMRRLPDPREYVRRCWSVPLAGIAVCLIFLAVTTALCYLIYMLCTPASCLVPGQWTRFWSAWIGR